LPYLLRRGKPRLYVIMSGGQELQCSMERKIFWTFFIVLGLIADVVLPLWWALVATIPIVYISWWVAYRSGWFE
jgi:hypothetical protein